MAKNQKQRQKPNQGPEEITVVAQLEVTSSLGTEIVKSFDKAWCRALELPVPVNLKFTGFVRKD